MDRGNRMLEKIAILYHKAQMGIISGLSGTSSGVIEEANFYDVGYMQTQISRVQKELKRITGEIETTLELKDTSDYGKKQLSGLMEQREQLLYRMVFLASNSFKNLDYCMNLAEGYPFVFMQCVKALQEYDTGNKEKAFVHLESYYKEHGSVEEHYLVNKVFGLLLAERGQYKKAVLFLTYALQFMPDDIESLNTLKMCYRKLNETGKERVISEILAVLG